MKEKTVLVIDDEKDIRESIAEALRMAHYDVIEAKNGEEGVALALGSRPDVILLDLMMPGLNGHDVHTMIRKDAWGKNAKIIVLTARSEAADIVHSIEQGGSDYLIKSGLDLKDIVNKVNEVAFHE